VGLGLFWTLFFPSVSLSFYPPVSRYDIQLLPGDPSGDSSCKVFNGSVWTWWGFQPPPTANVEDQAIVFMYPEDRVARLYPQSPDSSDISRLPLSVST